MKTKKDVIAKFVLEMDESSKQKLLKIINAPNISIYNLSHNEIDKNCCGIFDRVDKDGMIICNECNVKMRDIVLSNLQDKTKEFDEEDMREAFDANGGGNTFKEFIASYGKS